MNKDDVCIYMMKYNSAVRKKEILSFVTAWMKLDGTRISEISHKKTNTA